MLGDKLRFRFAKTGTLRLLSHHDLMRCLERMLRRAAVPFKSTAGFHPSPRCVFALSLPLGVAGHDEVVEVELTEPLESDAVLARLAAQAPAGLTFTRVSVVPMKATAIPRRVVYELPLPADRVPATHVEAAELMAQDKVWVDRLRPTPKRLNIRPYFRAVELRDLTPRPAAPSGKGSFQIPPNPPTPFPKREGEAEPSLRQDIPADSMTGTPLRFGEGPGEGLLYLDLWVTQTGTARAEELVRLLGVSDLLEAGAVLERTQVVLRDEVAAADPTDSPPDGPADARPLDPAAVAALTRPDDEANQPATAQWGLFPNGPVVE